MRKQFPDILEKSRQKNAPGGYATQPGDPCGVFRLRIPNSWECLCIVASNGEGMKELGLSEIEWEHVSVSLPHRCPTWDEMCWVKDLFWESDETVIQFHPPKSEYVNNHKYCLHLWKPIGVSFPMPPAIAVGVKSLGLLSA